MKSLNSTWYATDCYFPIIFQLIWISNTYLLVKCSLNDLIFPSLLSTQTTTKLQFNSLKCHLAFSWYKWTICMYQIYFCYFLIRLTWLNPVVALKLYGSNLWWGKHPRQPKNVLMLISFILTLKFVNSYSTFSLSKANISIHWGPRITVLKNNVTKEITNTRTAEIMWR